MRSRLDWKKLREGTCPQCGTEFEHFTFERVVCKCGFSISDKRLKEIVMDMETQELDNELDKKTDDFLEGYHYEED
ncbi:MAG: hypothetical protein V3S89_10500 [Desulfobacterales bacterium]